jgi:hypothetical protein
VGVGAFPNTNVLTMLLPGEIYLGERYEVLEKRWGIKIKLGELIKLEGRIFDSLLGTGRIYRSKIIKMNDWVSSHLWESPKNPVPKIRMGLMGRQNPSVC